MENKTESQNVGKPGIKKYLKIIAIILAVILLLIIGYFVFVYIQIQRGEYVKWDGKWYTNEELKEKYPPQYNESIPQNTPEEVYSKFRQALIDDNFELALEQIVSSPIEERNIREKYRKSFQDKDRLNEWIKTLPENIEKIEISGNYATYRAEKNTIHFFKDYTGYWKIESI